MSAQSLESYNREGTGGSAWRRHVCERGICASCRCKTWGFGCAFEILWQTVRNTVFRVARQMMRNNEDAEDVVQESFQQAFIHLKSFKGDSRFRTWLSRIAINAALMKLRRSTESGVCRWMNRPKSMSRLPGSTSKTKAESRTTLCTKGTGTDSLRGHEGVNARNAKQRSSYANLASNRSEETARIMGISAGAGKGASVSWRRKLRERLKHYFGSAWTYGRDASRNDRHARTYVARSSRLQCV